MKSNKGASLMDIVMSIIILSLFVGIIGTLFYQIAFNSNMIKFNALATHYAVKIAEDIDKIAYDDITDEKLATLIQNYKNSKEIEDPFNVRVSVQNYNVNDNSKEDILKIVTIQVDYSFINRDETYQINKLKVKEI